jgi:hypothetical protein
MADSRTKNPIYVETDYDNIVLIDPNKIVINNEVKDRLVDHQELVFYANLETRVIPRTKLAVGESFDSPVVNTTVASMKGTVSDPSSIINFLQPLKKSRFDTTWTDQITGKGSRQGLGLNQTSERVVVNNQSTRFERDVNNYSDTQMLGITSIEVSSQGFGITNVTVELVDVQGRTLFEQGEKSIYSVFFNLPYPMFYLTIKGYYGKAIKYALNLTKFNASFDQSTGNYNISLTLLGKLTGLLSDTILDYAKTAPKMFPTTIQTFNSNAGASNASILTTNSSVGRQKLDEVYNIYKSKGLIPETFPHLTIEEYVMRADNFTTNIKESIEKGDFAVLNDIQSYQDVLDNLKQTVYNNVLNKYLDTSNYIVYDTEIYYAFKNNIDFATREKVFVDIQVEINAAIENLKKNASFGENGSYVVGTETFTDQKMNVTLKPTDVFVEFDYTVLTEADYKKTLEVKLGRSATDSELALFKSQLTKDFELYSKILDKATNKLINTKPTLFKYGEKEIGTDVYKVDSFLWKIADLSATLKTKKEEIEQNFSNLLAEELINNDTGLGFNPSIRNIFAVIFAGVDTFYRLMERTHLDAWSKKNEPKRLSSIIPPDKNFSLEAKNVVNYDGTLNDRNLVYPWPTYFTLEKQADGRQLYTVQYLADPKFASATNAFNYSIWPEIFFTEEYLDASIRKIPLTTNSGYVNPKLLTNYASCNGMEFPFSVQPYENVSEVSFFYEFFERMFLTSHYTNIFRGDYKTNQVDKFISDIEANNISETCKNSPTLLETLKNIKFNYTTLVDYLKSISSNGTSDNWIKFDNDYFVTDYISSIIQKDYGLFSTDSIAGNSIKIDTTIPLVENFKTYLESSETNSYTYLDVLPKNFDFIESNDSTKITIFLDEKKTLANLKENSLGEKLSYYPTYETFNTFKNYNNIIFVDPITNTPIVDRNTLKIYYQNTSINRYSITGKYVLYDNYSGNVINTQTTSFLNTPFFINALLDGVEKEKSGLSNPYVPLGYLYLTSFIQPSLDGFIYNITKSTNETIHIGNLLSKYSAINQLPYSFILYMGAIWHRYKTWIESNKTIDILDDVRKNFDYKKYYDPTTLDLSKQYNIKNYTGGTISFRAFENVIPPSGTQIIEKFNLGFYPKVINDIHWYLTKKDLFTDYNDSEFASAYDTGKLKIGTNQTATFVNLPGSDLTNPDKGTIMNSFFQYLTFDKDPLVDKNNKIYVPIPSLGGVPFNQSVFECFNSFNQEKIKVYENSAVYNGSVRTLWGDSNFGYFDIKNQFDDLPNEQIFSFTMDSKSIEAIFSTFKKDILDDFEKAFLGFCNPNASASELLVLQGEVLNPTSTDTNKIKDIEQRRLKDQILNIFKVKSDSVTLVNSEDQDAVNIAQSQFTNFNLKAETFLKYDCVLKIGNPGNFDRKLFYNFSNDTTLQPAVVFPYDPYVYNSLPGLGQTTSLLLSRANNIEAWQTLELYVGFLTGNNLEYSDTGSTITDFFIDLNIKFNKENVASLYQIIKIYAKEKYLALQRGETWSANKFYEGFNNFLTSQNQLMSEMVIEVSSYLNKNLPTVKTTIDATKSKIEGVVTKLSTYNTFQAFNDKWIAGSDLTTRTIFEDFLFQDPSNTDIGDSLQIDPMKVSDLLKGDNNISILDVVGYINDFTETLLFALPSYVNFYGNNSPLKKSEPKNIDVPNSLFGTYEEVNFLDSRPKFLIVYVGKPSEKPAQQDNAFVFYGDDSYDFRNPSTNPIRVSTAGQYNFSLSNKVVGFNVDFGIRNQNMFKSLQIGMDDKKKTAATFLVNDQLANGVNGDKIAPQTTSLYSFYQSQSYSCTIKSLGNAMIQPLMYFNLKHVPLFYGPYLITKVSHSISPDNFDTSFEGTRMPKYALPQPDVIATYVKTNYLEKYRADILKTKNPNTVVTEVTTGLDDTTSAGITTSPESECSALITNPVYQTLPYVDITRTPITFSDFAFEILAFSNYNRYIAAITFTIAATRISNGFENNILQPPNYNLFEFTPINSYPADPIFSGSVICTSIRDTNIPLFAFQNFTGPISFMYNQYYIMIPYLENLKDLNTGVTEQERYEKAIAQLIIASQDTAFIYGEPSATPPIPPALPQQVKDFVEQNINLDNILNATYQSYIDSCKIAFTLFA